MNAKERRFAETVWAHYREHERNLPWRKTRQPYRIFISEIMLQQTQVDRVLPKYREFLKIFPDFKTLASASLQDVLRTWQGLGYNRRAQMLYTCAKEVVTHHNGRLPQTHTELQALPGIGPYTAGAVMVFAFSKPVSMIETNIRTVYLHHFFKTKERVSDQEILRVVDRTLDRERPRDWYYALMDYGSHIKRTIGNQNIRSRHYTKQSKFEGSNRQVRGQIVRALTKKPLTTASLRQHTTSPEKLVRQLRALAGEHFIERKNGKWFIRNA